MEATDYDILMIEMAADSMIRQAVEARRKGQPFVAVLQWVDSELSFKFTHK